MKAQRNSEEMPAHVKRAQRAFRRVAIKVRAEYKRHGMKPAVWPVEK